MAFLREVESCHAHRSDVGKWVRLGEGATVPVNVWAFTEGLVVAAASLLRWRRMQHIGPGESLTPDDIASAYRRPVFLERDRVDRIEIGAGRGTRKWIRLGVDHVIFDYVDGSEFDLMIGKRRTGELLPLLREIYPGHVRDHRSV